MTDKAAEPVDISIDFTEQQVRGFERRRVAERRVQKHVGLVCLIGSDGSSHLGELRLEYLSDTGVVVVVGVGHGDFFETRVADKLGDCRTLVGVRRGDPEHQVFVIELGDGRRGGGIGQHHHTRRNGDR